MVISGPLEVAAEELKGSDRESWEGKRDTRCRCHKQWSGDSAVRSRCSGLLLIAIEAFACHKRKGKKKKRQLDIT
jgi:hypothetical protein